MVQEVVVATSNKVTVHWEGGFCQWSEIIEICSLLYWLCRRIRVAKRHYPPIAGRLLHKAKKSLGMTVDQSLHPPKSKPLIDLLQGILLNGRTKATKPEDLVYSMMGIASDGDRCGIDIDYDKDYTEIFREAALLFLNTLGARALAWSGQLERNRDPHGCRLPSWVPDLRLEAAHVIHPYIPAGQPTPPKPKLFSAAGDREFEYAVEKKCGVLSLRTFYVDSVVEVSKCFAPMGQDLNSSWMILPHIRDWLRDFGRFFDASTNRNPSRYDYSTRQEMHWRVPITDTYWDEKNIVRRAVPEFEGSYTAVLGPNNPASIPATGDSQLYRDAVGLENRDVFVTQTGYIGLGHPDIVEGDKLHLVQGSDTPFMMRKSQGHHELIGETHVHGIMDGASRRQCQL